MTTVNRTIQTGQDKAMAIRLLEARPVPFTLSITDGKHRSTAQNKLAHMWMAEIAQQKGDMTPQDVRAYCKLTIGVPLLRAENEAFREGYDRIVRPLSYEQKIALMGEPLDLPVTRLMTTKQKTQYLDAIARHFGEQGIILTMPEDLRRELYSNTGEAPPSASPVDDETQSPPEVSSSEPSDIANASGGSHNSNAADDAPASAHEGSATPPTSPVQAEPSNLFEQERLSINERALLIECCSKFMSLTVRQDLDPAGRRDALALAKDAWKAEVPQHLHPKVASMFLSADNIIRGKAVRENAIAEFAHFLDCKPQEIGG